MGEKFGEIVLVDLLAEGVGRCEGSVSNVVWRGGYRANLLTRTSSRRQGSEAEM